MFGSSVRKTCERSQKFSRDCRLWKKKCLKGRSVELFMMPCWMFKCAVKFLWTCCLTYSERLRIDRRFSSSFHFFVLQKFYWYKNIFHRSSCTKDMKSIVRILISVIHWGLFKIFIEYCRWIRLLRLPNKIIYTFDLQMVVEGREIYDIRFS